MDEEFERRVGRIAEQALEVAESELDEFLRSACDGDERLRSEVEALLECMDGDDESLLPDPLSKFVAKARLDHSPEADSLSDDVITKVPYEKLVDHLATPSVGAGVRYRMRGEVGRGGMAAVLRVWDENLHRPLAMKVILGEGPAHATGDTPPTDSKVRRRFIEEAHVTGRLDHPGIVPVHELGVDDQGRVYFTMKLVKGRTLCEVFEGAAGSDEDWTQARVVGLILRVCEAVAYAHDKGVIHRDLKPTNVMVGRFGEVYVMDWGLARILSDPGVEAAEGTAVGRLFASARPDREANEPGMPLTHEGDVLGTPAYMPLEQASGARQDMGPHSDVYAVGAMLYHLLTGRPPYVKVSEKPMPQVVLQRVLEGPPDPIEEQSSKISPELVAICDKAMARDWRSRYATMQALAGDLQAFLDGRVVAAHATGAWPETKKWVMRNRALAGALASVIVVLITGLVVTQGFAEEARRHALAERSRADEVWQLSLSQDYEDLILQAEQLWPPYPHQIVDLRRWLVDATRLTKELPKLAAKRDELVDTTLVSSGRVEKSSLGSREGKTNSRWWHNQLSRLVEKLASLTTDGSGLLDEDGTSREHGWSMPRRLRSAERMKEAFAPGGEFALRWDRDLKAMNQAYPGLQLSVQMGLVPIGRDPASGLWEYWAVLTGTEPLRGANGRIVLEEDSGVVLVLLPGGRFWMGAQSRNREGRNYCKDAHENESPVHAVELSPFFVSKYEITQGQWRHMSGMTPSRYGPFSGYLDYKHDLTHPVEQVSWLDCVSLLPRFGLHLPSEAQWEYAARAGTDTSWWTGNDRESLRTQNAVNLADQAAFRALSTWPEINDWPELYDGHVVHAPVDEYAANDFGLHNVHGNVWEWCVDGFDRDFYGLPATRDPVSPPREGADRLYRGGSFNHTADRSRSSYRRLDRRPGTFAYDSVGVRPVRAVD